MAMRGRSLVPSTASRVLIQVAQHQPSLAGVVYSPYLNQAEAFADVVEFTTKMDNLFDSMRFPQATVAYRRFGRLSRRRPRAAQPAPAATPPAAAPPEIPQEGQPGTFAVHVQFRQNATWQGTVAWPGSGAPQRFYSMLQLLRLMDAALSPQPTADNLE